MTGGLAWRRRFRWLVSATWPGLGDVRLLLVYLLVPAAGIGFGGQLVVTFNDRSRSILSRALLAGCGVAVCLATVALVLLYVGTVISIYRQDRYAEPIGRHAVDQGAGSTQGRGSGSA